jgi:ubiquinol-cytochrome c reductase iron-sulfur subunit
MDHSNEQPKGGLEAAIALAFLASTCGAVGFIVVFWVGGQTQLAGVTAFVALAGFAIGLGLWANRAMPGGSDVEQRSPLPSTEQERRAFLEDFEHGEQVIVRRKLLVVLAGSGLLASAVAAVFPFRSLGPRPGNSLRTTPWRKGRRLVTEEGRPVRPSDLSDRTALTVFPEGLADPANSQTVLIRYGTADFRPLPGRESWTVDSCVAYSRVCTHLGCPVGLYEARTNQLVCPCHQSLFDVLDGARPQFGPATRPLPQLPLALDASGYLVAQSDFHEPVGPGFWDR